MLETSRVALSRAHGASLHRQVFVLLREQILRGDYLPGVAIPPEDELCGQFGVSKITVRRAVSDLRAQGLLESRQGRGTFVPATLPRRPVANLGLLDALSRAATETRAKVLDLGVVAAPLAIADQLGLAPGVEAFHVTRLRSKDGHPVMVTESWVPAGIARGLTKEALERQPLYEILMDKGVAFGRVVQEITAVVGSPYYAGLLRSEIGAPLLRMSRLLYNPQRQPVQHLTVHVSPERSRVLMDVSVDAVNSLTAGTLIHDVQR